jgi:uncharacterized membrane protein
MVFTSHYSHMILCYVCQNHMVLIFSIPDEELVYTPFIKLVACASVVEAGLIGGIGTQISYHDPIDPVMLGCFGIMCVSSVLCLILLTWRLHLIRALEEFIQQNPHNYFNRSQEFLGDMTSICLSVVHVVVLQVCEKKYPSLSGDKKICMSDNGCGRCCVVQTFYRLVAPVGLIG